MRNSPDNSEALATDPVTKGSVSRWWFHSARIDLTAPATDRVPQGCRSPAHRLLSGEGMRQREDSAPFLATVR